MVGRVLLGIKAIKDREELRGTMGCQVKMEVQEEKDLWDYQEIKGNLEQEVAMEDLEEWVDLEDRETQDHQDHMDI